MNDCNEQLVDVITKHCMSCGKKMLLTVTKAIKRIQGAERVKMFKLCMHSSHKPCTPLVLMIICK